MTKRAEVVNSTNIENDENTIKPKKKYYSVEDIVAYIKKSGAEEVTSDDVYEVFEKTNLMYFDVVEERLRPTEYLRKSGTCFETKNGKLLFTETGYKKCIETNDIEYNKNWLMWFCEHSDKLKGLYEL